MEDRLYPINVLLGLLLPNDVNLPAFANAGFRLAGLEIPARNPAGSVTIDCLLFHPQTNHLLLVEAKSGPHVERSQAVRYGLMSAQQVVQAAHVTLASTTRPTVETIYLCLAKYAEGTRRGLTEAGVDYPIVALGEREVSLRSGAGQAGHQLATAFVGGAIPLAGPPPRLISFDQDSDAAAIRPHVYAALVAATSHRLTQLTLMSLAERATPHFALYGRQAQQKIKKRVGEVIRQIARDEPANFEYFPATGTREGLVRILRTPEAHDARGRTQAYQAIGRAHKLGKTRRKVAPAPGQLDLLAELYPGDNEIGAETTGHGKDGDR